MVSEPTPTTSVSFGVTGLPLPLMGSARAGPMASAVADAVTAAVASSFLSMRMISAPPANEIGAPGRARISPASWPTAIVSDGGALRQGNDNGRVCDFLVNGTHLTNEVAGHG